MKRLISLMIALTLGLSVFANDANEKHLSAMFGYATFYLPKEDKPYVETYMSFDAWNLNFVKADNGYRATVEIIMVVKDGDSAVFAKKYNLNSPIISGKKQTNFNFLDLQRFYLKNGIYNLEMSIRDINSDQEPVKVNEKLVVYYNHKKTAMSTVQLMCNIKRTKEENIYSRNGFDMEPYVSDFIPEQMNTLSFYYEIYNIEKEIGFQPFTTYVYIEEHETGRRVGNIQRMDGHEHAHYVPIFSSLDISELPSGNYDLVVEVHNKFNENLMYKKVSFYRSNPNLVMEALPSEYATTFASQITDENALNFYMKALYPIASPREQTVIDNLVKRPGLVEKQAFFYNFWVGRDELDPKGKWDQYHEWLQYVEAHFAYSNMPGYKTDRGRVYLQYGPPDFIRDEKNFCSIKNLGSGVNDQIKLSGNTPQSHGQIHYLPYQIWRYNQLPADDPTRCFLFWDEFRVGNYQLLNSNARGEVRDPLWERRLSQQFLPEGVLGEVGEQFLRGY